ncbi:MAG: nitroreductase family protein [Clostridia bacterium]|nr:nitroreductase family protein [Clostridia bacterium]
MNFSELAKERFSVRAFKQDAIEEEKLAIILEAGRVAPTACNKQPQKIFVAKSEESREKLASVCRFTFDAPVVLVVCYDKERSWQNDLMPGYESGETDAAIVCTHMMLAAWEQGIGSCWVGWFNADEISKALGLSENLRVTAILPIGYPAEGAVPTKLHTRIRDFEDTITML